MGESAPEGIYWLLAGLATAVIALLGALVQVLVLVRKSPPLERGSRWRAALAGPGVALGIALAGGLSIDQFDAQTKATLDAAWIALPIAAMAPWFWVNRKLIRGVTKA